MANDCLPQIDFCRIRVSRCDPNSGVPLPGASNLYVSDAAVSLAFKWVVEAGDEIKEKDGCGSVVVDYKNPDTLLRGEVTLTLWTPDPQLSEMLSGTGETISDGGAAVGFAAPSLGVVPNDVVSIEGWAKRVSSRRTLDPTFPYAWWTYPWITNLKPADHEHSAKNLGAVFMGDAYENPNWFNGPTNDWPSSSDRVYQWIPTAGIPAASCGYQALAAS